MQVVGGRRGRKNKRWREREIERMENLHQQVCQDCFFSLSLSISYSFPFTESEKEAEREREENMTER